MASDLKFLSDHFTWAEAFITTHREITNTVDDPHVFENIAKTAGKLEKVRALLGVPILISSWFRCPLLNIAVGGEKSSDHLIGAAVDFIAPHLGTPYEVAKKIADNADLIGFKQLIMEHTWVHISWDMIPNTVPRREVLSLLKNKSYAKGFTDMEGNPLT